MKIKGNRTKKKTQQRQKSYSQDKGHKRSNFSSLIFQSGRNSLCSPRAQSNHPRDKYDHYMHYITSGKFVPQFGAPRPNTVLSKGKSITPTPKRTSTSLIADGRKSTAGKQNSRNEKQHTSRSKPEGKSPLQGYKPLFVKGSNIVRVDGESKKKDRPASSKKKMKGEKCKIDDRQEDKQKKMLQKLFKGIQFHRDLGRGAHALVKSGVDWNNKRKIAVKIYEKKDLKQDQLKSINREVDILGSLSHHCIIKLYEIIQSFKTINLVMQYGGGNSVQQYMRNKKKGYIDESEGKQIFREILEAVAYLHDKGVVHRDIKTDNVLLNKYLKVKIIDFGFSLRIDGTPVVSTYCGTPTYMSPEVVTKTPYNPFLSDRWSLGILLFTMLNGHPPFRAQNQKQLFVKICEGKYQFQSHVSHEARELISQFLISQPQERLSPREALENNWVNKL